MDIGIENDQVGRPTDGVRHKYDEHHPGLPYGLHERLVRGLTREAPHLLLGRVDVNEDAHVADGDDDKRNDDADRQVEHRVAVHEDAVVAPAQRHLTGGRPVHVRRRVDEYAEKPRGGAADRRRAAREDGAVASVAADVHVAVDGDEADAEQRAGAAYHAHAAQGGVQARLVVVEVYALDDAWGQRTMDVWIM